MSDYAFFIDFDGTLVEIAETPDAVRVDGALPGLIARLRDRSGGALALVSGRAIAVLDGYLTPLVTDAAGLHGLERRVGGQIHPCRPEAHPRLRHEIARIAADAPPDLLIEDKGCSVALHWRLTPDLAEQAASLVERASEALGDGYRVQEGKAVLEILPTEAGKGGAIAALMRQPPYLGRLPVFIGDDRTDEHGFVAVNEAGGVSIKIGPGLTSAQYRIASAADLRAALAPWAEGGFTIEALEAA